MNHPDNDKSATSGEPSLAETPALGRRRALLNGLGKGGSILAAATPISSFAAGRVKTADGKQCTVSGQMSVAMSKNATDNPCAAFHPTNFFTSGIKLTSTLSSALRNAINPLAVGSYYVSGTTAVYYKKSATEVRKLLKAQWPAAYNAAATVGTVFGGGSTTPLLQILHQSSEGDDAYFIAAFFSAYLAAPPGLFEKVPFAASDVLTQYAAGSTQKAAAVALYRLICQQNKNIAKLV